MTKCFGLNSKVLYLFKYKDFNTKSKSGWISKSFELELNLVSENQIKNRKGEKKQKKADAGILAQP